MPIADEETQKAADAANAAAARAAAEKPKKRSPRKPRATRKSSGKAPRARAAKAPDTKTKGSHHVIPKPPKQDLKAVTAARQVAHDKLGPVTPENKAQHDLIDQVEPVLPHQNPPPGMPRVEVPLPAAA